MDQDDFREHWRRPRVPSVLSGSIGLLELWPLDVSLPTDPRYAPLDWLSSRNNRRIWIKSPLTSIFHYLLTRWKKKKSINSHRSTWSRCANILQSFPRALGGSRHWHNCFLSVLENLQGGKNQLMIYMGIKKRDKKEDAIPERSGNDGFGRSVRILSTKNDWWFGLCGPLPTGSVPLHQI